MKSIQESCLKSHLGIKEKFTRKWNSILKILNLFLSISFPPYSHDIQSFSLIILEENFTLFNEKWDSSSEMKDKAIRILV